MTDTTAEPHVAPITCFREQLRFLEDRGEVTRIKKTVSPKFEIAAVAQRLDPGPALIFESVEGSDLPVVLGTDGDRRRIAESLGLSPVELIDRYVEAISNPLPPTFVDEAPVQERVIEPPFDIVDELPIMTHYEHDGGPYLTTGIVIVEDAERGIRNMSYHRMQVVGPDELRAFIVPRHLRQMLEEAEKRDETVQVAIVLGMDSAQRLAAATWGSAVPIDLSELGISGALKGVSEELVRCKTMDVHVPANAEIVIEAEIEPHSREKEGPFAEYTGNYGRLTESPVFRLKAITRRHDAMCQGLVAVSSEHHNLLGLPYEPVVLKILRGVLPHTEAVHITAGGCGKFHVVVRIDKRHEGDGKDAIIGTFHAVRDIKMVTVVDSDVDLFNPRDVEWAVATRVQADSDVIIISGTKGNELDPSSFGTAITAKMGIDATKPLQHADQFERAIIPGAAQLDLDEYLR